MGDHDRTRTNSRRCLILSRPLQQKNATYTGGVANPTPDTHDEYPMSRDTDSVGEGTADRAISPVVGAVLMIVLTILLASTIVVGLSTDLPTSTASDVASGDLGEADSLQEDLVVAEESTAGADGVVHSTVVEVTDADGEEWSELTVDYPKDPVDLDTSSHDEILTIGVDTDGDGDLEETFDADGVSGVNTNDDNSDLTVTFDTGYELDAGDRVHLRYEGANNPDAAGEYDVSVRINDAGWTEGTLTIED